MAQNDPGVLDALMYLLTAGTAPAVESGIATPQGHKPPTNHPIYTGVPGEVAAGIAAIEKGQGAKRKAAPAAPATGASGLPAGVEKSPWFGDIMGGRK